MAGDGSCGTAALGCVFRSAITAGAAVPHTLHSAEVLRRSEAARPPLPRSRRPAAGGHRRLQHGQLSGAVCTAPTVEDAAKRRAPRGRGWTGGRAGFVFLTCLAEPSIASRRDEGLGRRPATTPSGPNPFAKGGVDPPTASAAASPVWGRRASPASPARSDERGGVTTLRRPMAEEAQMRDRLARAVGAGDRGTVAKTRGQARLIENC